MASAGMYILVDGVLVRGATARGPQGEQGEIGPEGPVGADGPAGVDGVPASESMAVDESNSSVLIVTLPEPDLPDPVLFTSIAPDSGLNTGGYEVVIIGSGFDQVTEANINGADLLDFEVISDTEIHATMPDRSGSGWAGPKYLQFTANFVPLLSVDGAFTFPALVPTFESLTPDHAVVGSVDTLFTLAGTNLYSSDVGELRVFGDEGESLYFLISPFGGVLTETEYSMRCTEMTDWLGGGGAVLPGTYDLGIINYSTGDVMLRLTGAFTVDEVP